MSVTLKPDKELGFQRPLTQLVKKSLSVTNGNGQPVAFKVKTTAPKQYCVRPNSGRIEPGETVQVQVLLQPMKEDPPAGAKCRDKFLVQSVFITAERESQSLQELWSTVEKEGKDSAQIYEHKIRCAYLAPDEADSSSSQQHAVNGNGHETPSSAFQQAQETASSAAGTVASGAAAGAAAVGLTGLAQSIDPNAAAASSTKDGSSADKAPEPAPRSPEEKAQAKAEQTVDTASLQSQLAAAQTEIKSLKEQLSAQQQGSSLRNRGTNASGDGTSQGGAVAQQAPQHVDGVPIHIVLGIAFAVFVFTWLFF